MFKRYLWKLCWLAFALVKRGESMKKTYLVVIVLFFISTKVYTLLHNNIFFCRNSPECDLSHVLPDYREQISGTPLKYTLINTAPLAQVVVRHYELLSQHWSPDDMVTPAQWRHNVDIYIPETAKEHHALVVVNNGINYDKGVQITGKPGDFPQETLASISRDTNTIVISVSDIPNQYLTFQDDKKPLKEDESVSRSWALFMEAPEQRKLMPLNIPMVTALSQAMRLAKKELTQWNINSFIITGISKRGWTTWLSAIADPDVEAIVPFAIDLLDIDASLEHIYQSYGGNWPITFYPYYQQGIDEKIKSPTFTQLRQIIDPLRYLNTIYQPRLAIPKYIINGSAITLMSVSLFLLYLTGPIYWAVIQDVVHKDKVGSVGGAMHGLANISGIIGPLVTGFIVQFSGKYDYAFYLAGAIAIVSSLLVFVFVKSKGFKANESQSCVH
ncbi:hypothetical protein FPM78_03690 [Salmonella enterica]|uniref:PhoPQ-regulated protein n=1 Tax=Salmonella enterica TaxID=28901 RepID=A0A5U4D819_SALER|nr:hypothetical protein [Salmonella enterica]EDC7030042.1 hypothetical protein [Salmonella enterica subsp. enterica serovar Muenchen]EAS1922060.1 hypothetical protein [Salmonella enterica]EBA3732202.1 hypothetical protein [Salmonella enterica]EBI1604547.1 hypothetical protein [Salmonella enterica]